VPVSVMKMWCLIGLSILGVLCQQGDLDYGRLIVSKARLLPWEEWVDDWFDSWFDTSVDESLEDFQSEHAAEI